MNRLTRKALGQARVAIQETEHLTQRAKNTHSDSNALTYVKKAVFELSKAREWLTAIAETLVEEKEDGNNTE